MTSTSPDPSSGSAAAQDAVDWPAVLAEHDRWLRTVVYARLGEREGVDEVMRLVALAAVRQAAPLADPQKAGPWLYRVALNQTLMYRRKLARERKRVERYVAERRPQESDCRTPDPLDWLLADERRKLVQTALSQLRPTDAQMLLLKYAEDWSYRQIAERLGVSEAAVETRLHRARQRLRSQLLASSVVSTA